MDEVTTYYLEMNSPSSLKAGEEAGGLEVHECGIKQYQFNKFLYRLVGEPWKWTDRLEWTDSQWRAFVEDDNLRTWVAYHSGSPAGYYELQRQKAGDVEIAYFGLAPAFIGRGFGGLLLSRAIISAWEWEGTRRVWVHTCTLDHPNALGNYIKRGMTVYRTTTAKKPSIRCQSDLKPGTAVFGLSGSPRIGGNSDILLKKIISGATRENVPSEAMNLTEKKFQGCIGCEKCRKDKVCTGLVDGMSVIYERVISSRGLVLVSPAHNYNITSWMKAFIDRLYCFYNFQNERPGSRASRFSNQGRKAVIAAVCEQESVEETGFALEAMKRPLEALGYEIIAELPVFGIIDKAKARDDNTLLGNASRLGRALARAIK